MDIAMIMKVLTATWLSGLMDIIRGAALNPSPSPAPPPTPTPVELPIFRRALPQYDDISGDVIDEGLTVEFPGQFYTETQINEINSRVLYQARRQRRAADKDLCCVTNIWFGAAPKNIEGASDGKKWPVVQGWLVEQAYSRGMCHRNNPQTLCPRGGKCEQKYRLHTIWVRNGTEAALQYFNIPSHCSYEPE